MRPLITLCIAALCSPTEAYHLFRPLCIAHQTAAIHITHRTATIQLCDGSGASSPDEQPSDREFLLAAAAERARFLTDEDALLELGSCWALLFNAGSGNEGIYSRRMPTVDGSGGFDIVMCWEEQEDAERYADMLSASDFPSATPAEVETESLLAFCNEGGHTLGCVRKGDLVVPPENSVEKFEWTPGVSEESTAPLEGSEEDLDAARGALEKMLGLEKEEDSGDGDKQ